MLIALGSDIHNEYICARKRGYDRVKLLVKVDMVCEEDRYAYCFGLIFHLSIDPIGVVTHQVDSKVDQFIHFTNATSRNSFYEFVHELTCWVQPAEGSLLDKEELMVVLDM